MQHLPFPVTEAKDEAVIEKLAKKAEWAPYEVAWIAAYKNYRANQGVPFAVAPHVFGDGVGDLQYKLYDKRKQSGEIYRMRRKRGLLSCPVCGSPVTGDLDHYLPRTTYPEFAIMRANLIPACTHCNSSAKGSTVPAAPPGRFIHPYFDQWANQPLWIVEILQPFEAATFRPAPIPSLSPPHDEIVHYHLDNVLGDQFHRSMENEWSTYPGQVAARGAAPDHQFVVDQVNTDLTIARLSRGENGWLTALLRGLQANADALAYVQQRAVALR